jgi:hypothetical protein
MASYLFVALARRLMEELCMTQAAEAFQDERRSPAITSPWLDTTAAAAYLGNSPKTLAIWRCRGEGPRYHVVNRRLVRYHVDDLDAFVRGEDASGKP